jgi:hypothetical protein
MSKLTAAELRSIATERAHARIRSSTNDLVDRLRVFLEAAVNNLNVSDVTQGIFQTPWIQEKDLYYPIPEAVTEATARFKAEGIEMNEVLKHEDDCDCSISSKRGCRRGWILDFSERAEETLTQK